MSVRKRMWTTAKGAKQTAWIVDYADREGDRHIRTFARKKQADDYHATVKVEVRHGVHTAPSKSATVAEDVALKAAASRDEGRQLSKSACDFVERATRRDVSELA